MYRLCECVAPLQVLVLDAWELLCWADLGHPAAQLGQLPSFWEDKEKDKEKKEKKEKKKKDKEEKEKEEKAIWSASHVWLSAFPYSLMQCILMSSNMWYVMARVLKLRCPPFLQTPLLIAIPDVWGRKGRKEERQGVDVVSLSPDACTMKDHESTATTLPVLCLGVLWHGLSWYLLLDSSFPASQKKSSVLYISRKTSG